MGLIAYEISLFPLKQQRISANGMTEMENIWIWKIFSLKSWKQVLWEPFKNLWNVQLNKMHVMMLLRIIFMLLWTEVHEIPQNGGSEILIIIKSCAH